MVRVGAVWVAAVKKRIKATANVAKLTGVMKMVASAKLKFVEERLQAGKPFGVRGCVLLSRLSLCAAASLLLPLPPCTLLLRIV